MIRVWSNSNNEWLDYKWCRATKVHEVENLKAFSVWEVWSSVCCGQTQESKGVERTLFYTAGHLRNLPQAGGPNPSSRVSEMGQYQQTSRKLTADFMEGVRKSRKNRKTLQFLWDYGGPHRIAPRAAGWTALVLNVEPPVLRHVNHKWYAQRLKR